MAREVSRHGPDRSRVASVAAAVSDSPLAGLSDRNSPISRSNAAASPPARPGSASVSSASPYWAGSVSSSLAGQEFSLRQPAASFRAFHK